MTLDELLAGLFPAGASVQRGPHGTASGTGRLEGGKEVAVVGVVDGTPLGIDGALILAGHVLDIVAKGGETPIVVLVDTSSQNMARRDELLGLNEYLAHLSKSLALASIKGHATVGVLYGHAAAGAFISTALSTQILAALPGAYPSVMDLPSISRVTKLPLDTLKELAKSTPIFAPGLDPLYATGAVTERWEVATMAGQLKDALATRARGFDDRRDEIGLARKGRLRAHEIAAKVEQEASA